MLEEENARLRTNNEGWRDAWAVTVRERDEARRERDEARAEWDRADKLARKRGELLGKLSALEQRLAEVDRLVDMAGDWIETDKSLRSTACIEVALDHAKELDAEVLALRQRVEHLEARVAGEHFESVGWQKRAEAAEAKLARCVEALKDIGTTDGDCVCDSGYSVGYVARAALAAAKGE